MTPQELDERIATKVSQWFGEPVPAVEDDIKQLIRDCIEAVTPEQVGYSIKSSNPEYKKGWMTGAGRINADFKRRVQANTKRLLGELSTGS